jgi:hypothetical protein
MSADPIDTMVMPDAAPAAPKAAAACADPARPGGAAP